MDASQCRLIHQWGSGLEGVDLAAARERGIWVANVPASGSNADSVAEHCLLLILALLRRLPEALANARSGVLGTPVGLILAGRTVCLYGLGATALSLARRLQPFGVRLLGITRDPEASKVAAFALDRCYASDQRDECLSQTDVLVLCSRLCAETRGMIDARALAALRPGSILVNAARGALIDYRGVVRRAVQPPARRRRARRVLAGTDRARRSSAGVAEHHRDTARRGGDRPLVRRYCRRVRREHRAASPR